MRHYVSYKIIIIIQVFYKFDSNYYQHMIEVWMWTKFNRTNIISIWAKKSNANYRNNIGISLINWYLLCCCAIFFDASHLLPKRKMVKGKSYEWRIWKWRKNKFFKQKSPDGHRGTTCQLLLATWFFHVSLFCSKSYYEYIRRKERKQVGNWGSAEILTFDRKNFA